MPSDQYETLLSVVMARGVDKADRTGTGTRSIFGYQMRFNLAEGFPLVTTKRLHIRSIVGELLWMISGSTDVDDLHRYGVTIWDEWADGNGDLGPIYGEQWRAWRPADGEPIDQLHNVIEEIKLNPDSRRLVVSAWNVGELLWMALPPCHCLFQFYVAGGRLSCQLYQRSCDLFLGVPFNIASYSLLTHMVAQQTGLDVGEFIWTGGDCHVYRNHFDQVRIQLSREPRPYPQLHIRRKPASIDGYTPEDFEFIGYNPWPHITGQVSV